MGAFLLRIIHLVQVGRKGAVFGADGNWDYLAALSLEVLKCYLGRNCSDPQLLSFLKK